MRGSAFTRYVALGDSRNGGAPDAAVGAGRSGAGWAARLAAILEGDARLAGRDFHFTELSAHARGIEDLVVSQTPAAVRLGPDLVSVMAGGDDLIEGKADPDALASRLEGAVRELRSHGATVLLANVFDPQSTFFLTPLRGRAAVFNANIWTIARQNEAIVLDVWGVREFRDAGMWAPDRIHLSARGHTLLSVTAAHALGLRYAEVAASAGVDRARRTVVALRPG